mmetsp:Transcript_31617/g.28012  ORF Transcript_31617/g.28012 Transcript_31617/m.28012 type:complete len:89 (-) Transcript_31617:269-535(-)
MEAAKIAYKEEERAKKEELDRISKAEKDLVREVKSTLKEFDQYHLKLKSKVDDNIQNKCMKYNVLDSIKENEDIIEELDPNMEPVSEK